jgi:hypothetical protein
MATASLFFGRHLMTCLNPPNPLFKGAHQAFVRTRAHGHRFAVLRPASDDALFNPPIPLFKGPIRACGLSIASMPSLPANSGPASDDALLILRSDWLRLDRTIVIWKNRTT